MTSGAYTTYNTHNTQGVKTEYPCPKPPLSPLRAEVINFAKKADQLAYHILAETPTAQHGSTNHVYHEHHHYHDGWLPYYRPSPTVVVVGSENTCNKVSAKEKQRENEKSDAIGVMVVAALVAGATAYFLGTSYTAYCNAEEELKEIQNFKMRLNNFEPMASPKDKLLIAEAHKMADLKARIFVRKHSSEWWSLALKVGLIAACGMIGLASHATYTGTMTADTEGCMSLGKICGLVSGGGLMFKWGYNSKDTHNIRDAQALNESIQKLRRL